MSAREAMLQSIRAAVKAGADPMPRGVPAGPDYRRHWNAPVAELVDRLEHRLRDYGAEVRRVATEAAVAEAAGERLLARGVTTLLTPPDLPVAWIPAGVAVTRDAGQAHVTLNALGGAMTGCALAVAETGTIVLDGGARQGRRVVTLLPDYWLCVVFASQVVGLVPEAVARLRENIGRGRPLTFASGPSATSDIELRRVHGVHGPRKLDVIVVEDG